MDEEDVREIQVIRPFLHNRWSLLVFALGAAHEIASTISGIIGDATVLAVEHGKQKMYDQKFKEITR